MRLSNDTKIDAMKEFAASQESWLDTVREMYLEGGSEEDRQFWYTRRRQVDEAKAWLEVYAQ